VKIRSVKAICTAPAGTNITVVKVETDEPELYGIGCATFAYRHRAVACVVEEYLSPLLVGRDVEAIEDLWHLMHVNAYWRNGPIGNNAISGVDMALWDIKGKMAGMPVYNLLGGKVRKVVPAYTHIYGENLEDVVDGILKGMDGGIRCFRIHWGRTSKLTQPLTALDGVYFDPERYIQDTLTMFQYVREKVGYDIRLCHDVHERISPVDAIRLAKRLEPFQLFFLEDALPPEQSEWYGVMRRQTSTPIAIGELFNNPKEWTSLIVNRNIDFIRAHLSQVGGITPARKLAIFAEPFGVRTAWHGPEDCSPVGHAANVHLDLVSRNFGIQEWWGISDAVAEVFPGSPVLKDGNVEINDRPGLGVDINEPLAGKFPCTSAPTVWTQKRILDGTIHYP
jgi:mannonate dehydratase